MNGRGPTTPGLEDLRSLWLLTTKHNWDDLPRNLLSMAVPLPNNLNGLHMGGDPNYQTDTWDDPPSRTQKPRNAWAPKQDLQGRLIPVDPDFFQAADVRLRITMLGV